jgi:methylated-DNA-[protein]-cysteine S-methyltransferase
MLFTTPLVRRSLLSPSGPMTLGATPHALVWIGFDGQKHAPDTHTWPIDDSHPLLERAAQELGEYFAGQRRNFDLPLDLSCGTVFQQKVWRSLLGIEVGTTSTYGAICNAIGQPKAARAVGAAIGRNPISIVVPCHRVVGSSGALTGYAGGIDRKIALLQLESTL